ncbi:YceI family protein [Hymenobacter lutimineralis]|uniref:YceI family protein n=1 Tax=Hymenobacter lutimineralis TaxID=2606448 RepID=A0A5D6V267_9BACT|nr:YceI family protein [Hymenobacter lutimineralis]TYZ09600.1 YceI family protein [Hymenobacter lutimineralis]
MKAYWLFLCLLLGPICSAFAQGKYLTRTGRITFFSSSPLEDIEARNEQVAAILDLQTGQVAFTAPMRAFVFPNSLMQEHFNENYVESEKYPRATFAGKLLNWPAAEPLTSGSARSVMVEGDLTIHGVKRRMKVPGTLELRGSTLVVNARFAVAPADYNIEIPLLVREHIAKSVAVTVALTCPSQP